MARSWDGGPHPNEADVRESSSMLPCLDGGECQGPEKRSARRIGRQLRLFLLSLAIFDDVGAILVVAVGYGETLNWAALALAMLGLAVVAGSARLGIRSVPIYFLLGGVIWLCFDASGIHPTVTGVVLGLMTPTRIWVSDERLRAILDRMLSYPKGDHWTGNTTDRRDLRRAGTAITESLSPVERLVNSLWLHFLRSCSLRKSRGGSHRCVRLSATRSRYFTSPVTKTGNRIRSKSTRNITTTNGAEPAKMSPRLILSSFRVDLIT